MNTVTTKQVDEAAARGSIEYRTVDKSTWDRGAWDEEPDKRQWTDAATGLPCLLVRNQTSGHYCGYVGVNPDHPLHGVGYSTCRLPTKCETSFCDHTPESILSAHGGITFASACRHGDDPSVGLCHIPAPGQPDNVWWFGFDCAHCDDLSPGTNSMMRGLSFPDAIYRDAEYVTAECAALAEQLAAIAKAEGR